MRRSRFRRPSSYDSSSGNTRVWGNIAALVLALVLLLLAGGRVSGGMAACYARMSGPAAEMGNDALSQPPELADEPNVTVSPPPDDKDAQ
jgi:hypothetical protein